MLSKALPLFFATAMLLGGCSSLRVFPDADDIEDTAPQAKTLEQRHVQGVLADAGGLIRANSTDKARTLLDSIDKRSLNSSQNAQFGLLYAQIELSDGNAEQSLQYLQNIDPQRLNSADRRILHQSRVFAYMLTGDILAAAEERVELAQSLSDSKEQRDNQAAIFDALYQIPASELRSNKPGTFGGWMALTLLFKQYPRHSAAFETALRQWQKLYPLHPADLQLLRDYSAKLSSNFYPLRNIAVLLPESGPLAQAAQALKAGMQAAEGDAGGDKPRLRFYNSEAASPEVLYRQALTDGADMVIGPLEKEKLKLLADSAPLNTPVLALNDIPGLSIPNLYQFTLSPIEEAEQAAAKAWADGHRKVLILVPDSERGKRIAQGYADAWRQYGGEILKTAYYGAQSGDLKRSIETLLNFDESTARFRQIAEIIPDVQFLPRKRDDMDAIFINADPVPARALNRQLKSLDLGSMAVYATPHLYSSIADAAQNTDLDGITFCDIPWLFPGVYRDSIDTIALQALWKQLHSMYLRLLAMGIDAYRLSSRLPQLDKKIYHGATGNLTRLPDGHITRQLFCAKFSNGVAQPLGFADAPKGSAANNNVEDTSRPAVP